MKKNPKVEAHNRLSAEQSRDYFKARCHALEQSIERMGDRQIPFKTSLRLLKECRDYLSKATRIEWDGGDYTNKPPFFMEELDTFLQSQSDSFPRL